MFFYKKKSKQNEDSKTVDNNLSTMTWMYSIYKDLDQFVSFQLSKRH